MRGGGGGEENPLAAYARAQSRVPARRQCHIAQRVPIHDTTPKLGLEAAAQYPGQINGLSREI